MKIKEPEEKPCNQQEELMEQLYGIIDSKVQYIDYQTEMVTSSFIDIDSLSKNPSKNTLGNGTQVMDSIMANNNRILDKLQEFSATIKLLFLLRNELSRTNTIQVLDLLTDNKFTQLTDKELTYFLRKF